MIRCESDSSGIFPAVYSRLTNWPCSMEVTYYPYSHPGDPPDNHQWNWRAVLMDEARKELANPPDDVNVEGFAPLSAFNDPPMASQLAPFCQGYVLELELPRADQNSICKDGVRIVWEATCLHMVGYYVLARWVDGREEDGVFWVHAANDRLHHRGWQHVEQERGMAYKLVPPFQIFIQMDEGNTYCQDRILYLPEPPVCSFFEQRREEIQQNKYRPNDRVEILHEDESSVVVPAIVRKTVGRRVLLEYSKEDIDERDWKSKWIATKNIWKDMDDDLIYPVGFAARNGLQMRANRRYREHVESVVNNNKTKQAPAAPITAMETDEPTTSTTSSKAPATSDRLTTSKSSEKGPPTRQQRNGVIHEVTIPAWSDQPSTLKGSTNGISAGAQENGGIHSSIPAWSDQPTNSKASASRKRGLTPPSENGVTHERTAPSFFDQPLYTEEDFERPLGMTDEEYEIRRVECRTVTEAWRLHQRNYGPPREMEWTSEDEWSPEDEMGQWIVDATRETVYSSGRDCDMEFPWKKGMVCEMFDRLDQCVNILKPARVLAVLEDGNLHLGPEGVAIEEESIYLHQSSKLLFPVGYAAAHRIFLKGENGFYFNWESFLKKHKNYVPAPDHFFDQSTEADVRFQVGHRLEAFDAAEKQLCPATVRAIKGRLLLISFDGWKEEYDQLYDYRSHELVPCGWGEMTGCELHDPKNGEEVEREKQLQLQLQAQQVVADDQDDGDEDGDSSWDEGEMEREEEEESEGEEEAGEDDEMEEGEENGEEMEDEEAEDEEDEYLEEDEED